MYRVVRIGDKEIPMKATASTDLRYKHIFRADPFRIQTAPDYDIGARLVFLRQMAFVMAASAAGRDMTALTEDDFEAWLEELDHGAFVKAIGAIQAVYEGNDPPADDEDEAGNPNEE